MRIEGKEYRTIWFEEKDQVVKIIDQTKLPHKFIIKDLKTAKDAGFIFVINLFDVGGYNNLAKKGYKVENLIEFPGH